MAQKKFRIGLFGLTLTERATVFSVCALTRHRDRQYEVLPESKSGLADIVLVDGDDPLAERAWMRSPPFLSGRPAMLLSATPNKPGRESYSCALNRAYFAARLVRALDDLTIRHLGSVPQISIDDSGQVPDFFESAPSACSEHQPRALVIDDSATVCKQMQALLELTGVFVEVSSSAETGLELAENKPFDIIFLDVELPGMDGYSACRRLKARRAQPACPVIMLTGRDSAFDRIRGVMAGSNRYLTKPVTADDLYAVIRQYVSKVKRTVA
ncbi:MAG: response regulator [Wenzhouxiangellaceae bacterium]